MKYETNQEQILLCGERIKLLRLEKKMTQKELAERISKELNDDKPVTDASISQFENGVRFPNFEILKILSKIFEVSSDYLLNLTNVRNYKSENFRFAFSKETEGLTDEDIKEALTFYKLVKSKNN